MPNIAQTVANRKNRYRNPQIAETIDIVQLDHEYSEVGQNSNQHDQHDPEVEIQSDIVSTVFYCPMLPMKW